MTGRFDGLTELTLFSIPSHYVLFIYKDQSAKREKSDKSVYIKKIIYVLVNSVIPSKNGGRNEGKGDHCRYHAVSQDCSQLLCLERAWRDQA